MTGKQSQIGELTAAIRAEAADRRASGSAAALELEMDKLAGRFKRGPVTDRATRLKAIIRQTQRLGFINPNVPMAGRRPYLQPVKRVIQTAIRWYVGAIVSQIQEYIRADLHALRVAVEAIDSLESRVRELEERLARLESPSERPTK